MKQRSPQKPRVLQQDRLRESHCFQAAHTNGLHETHGCHSCRRAATRSMRRTSKHARRAEAQAAAHSASSPPVDPCPQKVTGLYNRLQGGLQVRLRKVTFPLGPRNSLHEPCGFTVAATRLSAQRGAPVNARSGRKHRPWGVQLPPQWTSACPPTHQNVLHAF